LQPSFKTGLPMARTVNRLTPLSVSKLTKIGRHADGGNLYLTIAKDGSKRWTFMYSIGGRQREAGFGPVARVTLAEARRKGAEWRSLLGQGLDPMTESRASRDAAPKPTFGFCVEAFIKMKAPSWRSDRHHREWRQTLADHAASLWDIPVDEVGVEQVLDVLQPLWARLPDAGSRLRGRIETILDFASASTWRGALANPSRWRGNLQHIFAKRPALLRRHHAAMPYSKLPKFIAGLRNQRTPTSTALEFIILTAARASEALDVRWDEIDVEAAVWTIPAARMKAGVAHRVPLSPRVIEILTEMSAIRSSDFVFAGYRSRRPLSRRIVHRLAAGAGVTVHGFRSTFRDWAGEETPFPRELAEAALAHVAGSAAERAYRRGDALEKRRALMGEWAEFCAGGGALDSFRAQI
jgi:integrase